MPNPLRRSAAAGIGPLVAGPLLCLLSLTATRAIAQDTPAAPAHLTPFQRQMEKIDIAISAAGTLTNSVSGIEKRDAHVVSIVTSSSGTYTSTSSTLLAISPSSTVGELFTLRYTSRPYLGFEFNFFNARTTQNYAFTTTTSTTPPTPPTITVTNPGLLPGGAQTGNREYSFGYVAHPRKIFGLQPFLGAGIGTLRFKPTPNGGEGLPFQYRAAYYYHGGLDYTFPDSHFGVRLSFRQLIYLAPDFQENYLTIDRRVRTSEPTFGFFARF
jgi:hypothetical protein